MSNKEIIVRTLPLIFFLTFVFLGCSSKKENDYPNIKTNRLESKPKLKATYSFPVNSNYISARALHEKKYENLSLKAERDWDSLNGFKPSKNNFKKGNVNPDYKTFGWHLYSKGSQWKNYNFSLLWGISYFSYTVKPETGSYRDIHQWRSTALVDSAKVNNCKVFLSISNFGKKNNSIFLKNQSAQKTLTDSISKLLAERDADGVNIDFEGVPKSQKKNFNSFIVNFSKALKHKSPKYMVSLCLYARDWYNIFDIDLINPYVDFYTLMGYDYYGSFSKNTGPVTPFVDSKAFGVGLQSSVKYYLNKGVHKNKLIIGLPYYGSEWYTKSRHIGATVEKFRSHPTYSTIKNVLIDSLNASVKFDSVSLSSYIVLKGESNNYRQLFFEDEKSLSLKYEWVKENDIGGVGIWALGYDQGYPELWNLLHEKFSKE